MPALESDLTCIHNKTLILPCTTGRDGRIDPEISIHTDVLKIINSDKNDSVVNTTERKKMIST